MVRGSTESFISFSEFLGVAINLFVSMIAALVAVAVKLRLTVVV